MHLGEVETRAALRHPSDFTWVDPQRPRRGPATPLPGPQGAWVCINSTPSTGWSPSGRKGAVMHLGEEETRAALRHPSDFIWVDPQRPRRGPATPLPGPQGAWVCINSTPSTGWSPSGRKGAVMHLGEEETRAALRHPSDFTWVDPQRPRRGPATPLPGPQGAWVCINSPFSTGWGPTGRGRGP